MKKPFLLGYKEKILNANKEKNQISMLKNNTFYSIRFKSDSKIEVNFFEPN